MDREKLEKIELQVNGNLPEYIHILSPEVILMETNLESGAPKVYTITAQDIRRYFKERRWLAGRDIFGNYARLGEFVAPRRKINTLANLLWNEVFARLNSIK